MNLRVKVFLVVESVLMALFLLIGASVSFVTKQDFSHLEHYGIEDDLSSVTDIIGRERVELSSRLRDWTEHPGVYRYVSDLRNNYAAADFSDSEFNELGIDMVAVIGSDGTVLFGKRFQDGASEPFPASFAKYLSERYVFGQSGGITENGLVALPEGTVLIASHPIVPLTDSSFSGGTLVFASFLDNDFEQSISSLMHLKFDAFDYADDSMSINFVSAKRGLSDGQSPFVSIEDDGKSIAGYAILSDLSGQPAVLIRVSNDRTIYRTGEEEMVLFMRLVVLIGASISLAAFFLFDRLVLRRLLILTEQVHRIRERGDLSGRVSVSGKDEFSALGDEINGMLSSLYDLDRKEKESEKRFNMVADVAPVTIWMIDADGKCTYVNQHWLGFVGQSVVHELGSGWMENIFPEDRPMVESVYSEARTNRVPFHLEYRVRRHDGIYRWILDIATPNIVHDMFVGYLGSRIDITEQRESDVRQNEYLEETERLNRIMIARELKMIELKEKIRALETK